MAKEFGTSLFKGAVDNAASGFRQVGVWWPGQPLLAWMEAPAASQIFYVLSSLEAVSQRRAKGWHTAHNQ